MVRYFRYLLIVFSVAQAFFAVAFILQLRFATRLWPFAYTNQMGFLFIASIFAAAAASTLWCIAAREDGALAGVALDYMLIFAPTGIFVFQIARNNSLILFGIVCVIGALFGLGMFLWSRRIPIRDPRPMPRLIRAAFIFFIIALVIVGVQMVLKVPNIMPWSITTQASVIYGWFFLGAAAYFAYGLLRPGWHNAAGQLAGFLAYDVVLIVPFLQRLPTIEPGLRLNLIIYTLVVALSGLLAIYYLFINPQTRMGRAASPLPGTA